MRTYKVWILIEMQDNVKNQPTEYTIIEEKEFVCASHEEAQELMTAAENAVNAAPLDSS